MNQNKVSASESKKPEPLWVSIAAALRERICKGQIEEGRGLSDIGLANEFKVSTAVVRQSMRKLVEEGLLTRTRGIGTFVNRNPLEGSLTLDRLDAWDLQGHVTRIEVVECKFVLANITIAAGLGINLGDTVLYLQRLRLADELPVTVDYRYIPSDLATPLDRSAFEEEAVWRVLQRHKGITPAKSLRAIKASGASTEVANLLGLPVGAPVLENEVQVVDSKSRLVILGTSFYHPDRFIYRDEIDATLGLRKV
ncbi:HTH-type transcriptional repressor YvoA (plasmid) [Variovorax sp. SRS16]|uniref:GntR family transcriptional regulator n=1 Tax=Variovorax sp. SRS16 TaxID=282217 RepID=UPI001316A392|nr:GntR family transcriptional regulator [Variovorax sp. SRS16]VTU45394.1 HTH-type transcriptional repressor YvoA [Variovorax sp. SRS16]